VPSGTCGLLREAERCEEERRTASRGREHLVDSERSERIYLVIRDRMRGQALGFTNFGRSTRARKAFELVWKRSEPKWPKRYTGHVMTETPRVGQF